MNYAYWRISDSRREKHNLLFGMVDIDKQRVHKQWVSNAHKKQFLLDAYHAQTANRPGVSWPPFRHDRLSIQVKVSRNYHGNVRGSSRDETKRVTTFYCPNANCFSVLRFLAALGKHRPWSRPQVSSIFL